MTIQILSRYCLIQILNSLIDGLPVHLLRKAYDILSLVCKEWKLELLPRVNRNFIINLEEKRELKKYIRSRKGLQNAYNPKIHLELSTLDILQYYKKEQYLCFTYLQPHLKKLSICSSTSLEKLKRLPTPLLPIELDFTIETKFDDYCVEKFQKLITKEIQGKIESLVVTVLEVDDDNSDESGDEEDEDEDGYTFISIEEITSALIESNDVLTSLSLNGYDLLTVDDMNSITRFHLIENLKFCDFELDNLRDLTLVLDSLKHLKSFNMMAVKFDKGEIDNILISLGKSNTLKSVEINPHRDSNRIKMESLFKFINDNKSIKDLILHGFTIYQIDESLQITNTTLESIDISKLLPRDEISKNFYIYNYWSVKSNLRSLTIEVSPLLDNRLLLSLQKYHQSAQSIEYESSDEKNLQDEIIDLIHIDFPSLQSLSIYSRLEENQVKKILETISLKIHLVNLLILYRIDLSYMLLLIRCNNLSLKSISFHCTANSWNIQNFVDALKCNTNLTSVTIWPPPLGRSESLIDFYTALIDLIQGNHVLERINIPIPLSTKSASSKIVEESLKLVIKNNASRLKELNINDKSLIGFLSENLISCKNGNDDDDDDDDDDDNDNDDDE